MKLPIVLPAIRSQHFDCEGCTHCCRELVVQLTDADRELLDRQGWSGKLGVESYVRLGGKLVLNHRSEGGCVFLTDHGKCRIHVEHGPTAKPLACRLYPFTLEVASEGLRAGIRFDCPTVAGDGGRPLDAHRRNLTDLAGQLRRAMPSEYGRGAEDLKAAAGLALSPSAADRLIVELDHWIRNRDRPLHQRLCGLHELVRALGEASLKRFDEDLLLELVKLLMADMPTFVEESEKTPVPPPTARQGKLLRLAVFAHCEHIAFQQARAPFMSAVRYRWNQIVRARRMGRGVGRIPRLGSLEADVGFDEIDRTVAGSAMDADKCDHLLTRYLQARITCRTAFGGAYYGWDLLDGLRSLLMALAVMGWLARLVGRARRADEFEFEDVVKAVGMVDRSVGRAAELGASSARLRVHYLSRDQGLLRLLRAYPILA